jgi:hypothetical protein
MVEVVALVLYGADFHTLAYLYYTSVIPTL